jgi:hypothetical protein
MEGRNKKLVIIMVWKDNQYSFGEGWEYTSHNLLISQVSS